MTTAIIPFQSDSSLSTLVDLTEILVVDGEHFLPANVSPTSFPALLIVSAVFSAAGVLSVSVIENGVERTMQLNSGLALRAGCLYAFSHFIDVGEEVNYTYSANCVSTTFKVQALTPEAQPAAPDAVSGGLDLSSLLNSFMVVMMVAMFGAMMMKDFRN